VGAEPGRRPAGPALLDAVRDPPVGELLGGRVLVSRAVVAEPRGGRTRQDSPVRLQLIVLAGRVDLVAGQLDGQLVLHVALEDRDVEAHPVVHGVVRQRIIARLRHAALDGDATVVRSMDLGIEDELAPRLEERFFAVQDLNPPQDYADLFATLFLHGILLWVCDGRVAVSPASTERGRPASSNDDTCRPGASAGASRAAPNGQLPLRIRHYRTTWRPGGQGAFVPGRRKSWGERADRGPWGRWRGPIVESGEGRERAQDRTEIADSRAGGDRFSGSGRRAGRCGFRRHPASARGPCATGSVVRRIAHHGGS